MLGTYANESMMYASGQPKNAAECKQVCDTTFAGEGVNMAMGRMSCYRKCADQFTEAKEKQDAGSILEGSASLVNAISGLYGTYVMGKAGSTYSPTLSNVSDYGLTTPEDDADAKRRKRNTWIIAGVGAVALGAVLYFSLRKPN